MDKKKIYERIRSNIEPTVDAGRTIIDFETEDGLFVWAELYVRDNREFCKYSDCPSGSEGDVRVEVSEISVVDEYDNLLLHETDVEELSQIYSY